MFDEILKRTMNEMPDHFTSHEFNAKAVENGYPERKMNGKGLAGFIRKYAKNHGRMSKSWTKKSALGKVQVYESIPQNVEDAIKLLKSKGYKVLKQKWDEL